MKYVKLMILYEGQDETLGECLDVPVGRIIPVSLWGKVPDKGASTKVERCESFSIGLGGDRRAVKSGVIYELRVPGIFDDKGKPVTFRYVFDEKASRRVPVMDLGAASLPELVLKLTISGLLHSTDSTLPDIPQAVRDLSELKAEAAEKDGVIEKLRGQVDELRERLVERENEITALKDTADRRPAGGGPKASFWKRMVENMFGSEGDEGYEA